MGDLCFWVCFSAWPWPWSRGAAGRAVRGRFPRADAHGDPVVMRVTAEPVLVIAHWCPPCEHFRAHRSVRTGAGGKAPGPSRGIVGGGGGGHAGETPAHRRRRHPLCRDGAGAAPRVVQGTPTLLWQDARGVHGENLLTRDPSVTRAVLDGGTP